MKYLNPTKEIIAATTWYIRSLTSLSPSELEFNRLETFEQFILDSKYLEDKQQLKSIIDKVCSDLIWLKNNEAKIITAFDEQYPDRFLFLKNPPFILSYFGDLNFSHQFLSVVGSRNPSSSSMQWFDLEVAKLLSHKKICIVSGGARGVDQKAHAIALRHQSPTYMLLPSGLAKMYPKNISSWKDSVVDSGGAIVSQFPPFEEMRKHYFHMRNQIIASFATHILIIDAKRRSGTMMTATYASSLGTDVLVVPNSPIYELSLGGLDLIYAGAEMVRNYEDIIEAISSQPVFVKQ